MYVVENMEEILLLWVTYKIRRGVKFTRIKKGNISVAKSFQFFSPLFKGGCPKFAQLAEDRGILLDWNPQSLRIHPAKRGKSPLQRSESFMILILVRIMIWHLQYKNLIIFFKWKQSNIYHIKLIKNLQNFSILDIICMTFIN